MSKISVIIPTYNRQARLKTAIRSVLAQNDALIEIIIIDDGSEDGTREMVLREFPDVKYFSFENQGPAAARNRGIERASGEWMAFLDSDDEWLSGKLKAQREFFSENPDYLVGQTEEIWIRNGRRVNPMKKHKKHGGWIFEACLPLCIVSPSAVMLHRSILDKTGFFDESLPACEDYDLWLRIAAKYPIGLIETPYIIKYGGHRDQRSREFPAMDRFRIRSLAKLLSSKALTPEQTKAAVKTLEEKSRIYCQGARKRGLEAEAAEIQALTAKALEISTTFAG